MSELSKERLLEILKDWFENFDWAFKEDKQAYQQLKELIQNQPEVDEGFIEKWESKLGVKVRQRPTRTRRWSNDYYVTPSKAVLKRMLKEAGVKIKE